MQHITITGPDMTDSSVLQFKSINYTGMRDGPRLIVTGAVHGNETCGTLAIGRVLAELDAGSLLIEAGSVTFVPVANPLAYAKGQRAGHRNLNRSLFPTSAPEAFEDHVANWLCPLLARHQVLLDLHSFSGGGVPFALVGPRNNTDALQPFRHDVAERALARRLGVGRFVDGWLATYAGGVQRRLDGATPTALEQMVRYGVGTTEYMRSIGGYGVTLECGQHADPAAPEVAYRAIRQTLAFLGLVAAAPAPAVAAPDMEAFSMVQVHDRQHPGDRFHRPWASFDPVRAGEVIGVRANGTMVTAEADGCVLFPDRDAAPGSEWIYLAKINPEF